MITRRYELLHTNALKEQPGYNEEMGGALAEAEADKTPLLERVQYPGFWFYGSPSGVKCSS